MADYTAIVKRAASRAHNQLDSLAPILLRMLGRPVFGCRNERAKERLALAQALVTVLTNERGTLRFTRNTIEDTIDKRVELVSANVDAAITDALAVSVPEMDASHTTALAVVTAMGLTAARTTTLTNMLVAMRDENKASCSTAVTSAAKDAGRAGSLRVLNKVDNVVNDRVVSVGDRIDRITNAIAQEAERLGIRI